MSVAAIRGFPADQVFARPAGAPSLDQLAENEDAIVAALRGLGAARRTGDEDAVRAAVTRVQLAAGAR